MCGRGFDISCWLFFHKVQPLNSFGASTLKGELNRGKMRLSYIVCLDGLKYAKYEAKQMYIDLAGFSMKKWGHINRSHGVVSASWRTNCIASHNDHWVFLIESIFLPNNGVLDFGAWPHDARYCWFKSNVNLCSGSLSTAKGSFWPRRSLVSRKNINIFLEISVQTLRPRSVL